MRGHNQGARLREFRANHPCAIQTFGRITRRHAQVDDDDGGNVLEDKRYALVTSPARPTTSNDERSRRVEIRSRNSTSPSAMTRPTSLGDDRAVFAVSSRNSMRGATGPCTAVEPHT